MAVIGSGPVRAHRRRRVRSLIAVLTVLALVAGVLAAVQLLSGGWGSAPAASAGKPVPVHVVRGHKVSVPPMPVSLPAHVSWPGAGTGTASFTAAAGSAGVGSGIAAAMPAGPTPGSARAGNLPVWVGQSAGTGPVIATRVPGAGLRPPGSKVQGTTAAARSGLRPAPVSLDAAVPVTGAEVSMEPQAAAAALGVRGAVFTVTGSAGTTAGGRVHVSLDYASFAGAYGGDYASRLHLVELPACALTTPQVPACSEQTPLVSADDVRASVVGADVVLPASATAAVASGSEAMGNPVLTAKTSSAVSPDLVLAATAATEGSGGNFGAEPLSEQDEWVTGGSSGAYTYSYPIGVPPVPGGLEPTVALDYDSQTVDGLNASTNNQASPIGDGWNYEPGFVEEDYPTCATNALDPDTLDLCYTATPEITVTIDGTTTPLVVTSGSSHLEADGAEQVNRTANGGYEIIEPDGTQYWFGVNDLPGYTSGDQATNSIWTVPQWNNGKFSTVPWRWMLDYVVDSRGDAIAYFYNTQTNYYAEDGGSKANGAYTQGGVLAEIEYGLRAGAIYSQTPAGVVTFTSGTSREDAPTDLACASGASCSVHAPTFWTTYQLSGIQTQSLVSGSLQDVDSWALADTYPATGDPTTSPSLWLSSITRTGQDGSTPVTLPPVSFNGTAMANLDQTSADKSAGYSLITRYRLTTIINQYGGQTSITYSAESAACKAGTFPKDYSNTGMCYPDYWYTNALTDIDREDWYNLYDAATVTATDTTGGDPPQVTSYTYASPAWHYDNDTISRSANWTWDQWRGFHSVITEIGTSPDPVTETADTYFQGMNDDSSDYRFSGGIITNGSVSLTSSRGNSAQDLDQYAGMLFEEIVYDGAGTGNEVTDTIATPYTSAATATDPTLYQSSYITGTTSTAIYTTLASGGTREATTAYSYNTSGQVLTVSDVPDTGQAGESTCTTTTFDPNTATSAWLVTLPEQVVVTSGACGSSGATTVSDTQYQYDGGAYGAVPSAGNVTQENRIDATATGTTVSEESTYDEYGRVLTSTDADSRTTTTAYTPATGAEPTSVKVTDPMGLVTSTTYDPARDLTLTVTDPANGVTASVYDALGRLTARWTPGNPESGPAVDTYSYTVSTIASSVTTEQIEEPGGGYLTTQTLDDSLGNLREVQQETAGEGIDVTDTAYNSDGWKSLVSDPYYVSGPPSGTLVTAASSSVPSQTGYVYDGDGRVLKSIAYYLGTETWETDTSYGGDETTVIPPAGGTPETTWTDGRGLTTAIWQYHAGVPVSIADSSSDYDATSYTHYSSDKLDTITDAAGNTWSYTYDQLGDELTQSDPDAGTTTSTYDPAGQLVSSTDARGKTISRTYDADGRDTAEYDTTGGALESSSDEVASWTYDTLAKGQPTSSISYSGGAAYTEEVTGYNSQELPSGTETIIPSVQGNLAGTYTQQDTYAPDGAQTSYTDSAAGGLPGETVTTGYDSAGNPDVLAGASTYVDSLSYTDLGDPLQYTMGTSTEPVYVTDSYDSQTDNLNQQDTETGIAETSVDDLKYTYNYVNDVTSEADTPSGDSAATDVQCFQYDYLNRLVQAWAQGTSGCPTTPSASAEGGPAPYWETYSYNAIGNLTGVTSTTPAGAVTTTTDTYPAAGAAHPHAITGQAVTTSSGMTNSTYGYDADGDLTSVASPSQDQALTWDDAGQLTQDGITPSGGSAQDTSYIYDAGSNLLITADPDSTTLYLPDEELTLSGGTVTGTRYYSLGGTQVATLTAGPGVSYVLGDQEGTDSVAINAAALSVTRRYYDPYGNTIGSPVGAFPEGEKGFVGGATDTATSLTDLGAREYQPWTGSFISTDSILKPYDPQDLNAYTYAADNPTTDSDPTGASCQSRSKNSCGNAFPGEGGPGSGSSANACSVRVSANFSLPCNTPNLAKLEAAFKSDPGMVFPWNGVPQALTSYINEISQWADVCARTSYCPADFKKEVESLYSTAETGMNNVASGWKCNWALNCNYAQVAYALFVDNLAWNSPGEGSAAGVIPTAQQLGADVADALGVEVTPIGNGYKLLIPSGGRGIMVRIMEEGGGRTNYWRVSIPGKQAFTIDGEASTDRFLTHIDISETSLEDILGVVGTILGDSGEEAP